MITTGTAPSRSCGGHARAGPNAVPALLREGSGDLPFGSIRPADQPDRDEDHPADQDELGDHEEEADRQPDEGKQKGQQELAQQNRENTGGGNAESGLQDKSSSVKGAATLRPRPVKGVNLGEPGQPVRLAVEQKPSLRPARTSWRHSTWHGRRNTGVAPPTCSPSAAPAPRAGSSLDSPTGTVGRGARGPRRMLRHESASEDERAGAQSRHHGPRASAGPG